MNAFTRLIVLFASATIPAIAFGHTVPQGFGPHVPPVIKPRPAVQPPRFDVTGAFANAYAAAGRPRIAVYWNRQLSDDVATQYEDYERRTKTREHSSSSQSDSTEVDHGRASHDAGDSMSREVYEKTRGTRRLPAGGARKDVEESTAWRLESAFYQPWLGAGAHLVDRALTMRTLNGGQTLGSTPDIQSVEVGALLGKADYLMEILVTDDEQSPIGARFRVTVKDVHTGQIVGLSSTRAMPPVSSDTRWVATAGGFEKRTTTEQAALEDFGRQLAHESMMQLVRAWGARG